MQKKERFRNIINYFVVNQPVAETELRYHSAYELLVAVILSAQCTDKRVNIITPAFFKRFPDAKTLSMADPVEVYSLISTCTYPNNKTKLLLGMARVLIQDFGGVVPADVELLQMLPGVGRKTANVIASVVFNIPALAVDTHVLRVAARLGLTTRARNPLQAERQLTKYIPSHLLPIAHHWLILHGRYICQARKPKCSVCPLNQWCKWYDDNMKAGSSQSEQKDLRAV